MHLSFTSFSTAALLLVVVQLILSPSLTNALPFGRSDDGNLYGLLGVGREATKDEIRKAFRAITRQHHPDMQEGAEAKEKAKEYMAKVLLAYNILSDDMKRYDYDQFGKVVGERLNAADFTSDELFERYEQQPPILSKSAQLESLTMLQRVLNFRGNRLFLIQVYDDSCKSCRLFSAVWENLLHTTLVEAGVIVMLRIDAHSEEGPNLLKELGVSYGKEVLVYGIIDGVAWMMPQLALAVKSNSERQLDYASMEFVGNFFYDQRAEVNSMSSASDVPTLLQWLREPRDVRDAIRVLLPPLASSDMGVALAALYEGVAVVRNVPRATLLSLVEEYCLQSVDVVSNDGRLVPVPEFVVVSLEQLPNASGDEVTGDKFQNRSCKGIVIGASAALTYRKAIGFLSETIPGRHVGMSGLTHITSASFFNICRRHCLLWIRDNCEAQPADAWLKTLKADFEPFKVGYVCMNTEPSFRDAFFSSSATVGDLLVAVVDGEDSKLHVLSSVPDKSVIAQSLSSILASTETGSPLLLEVPLSRVLASAPFRMSHVQYLYVVSLWIIGLLYPFFSTCYPFFMMFVTHKLLQRFNLIGGRGGDSSAPEAGPTSSTSSTPANACASDAVRRREGQRGIEPYTVEDLKDGKGFLVLIFNEIGDDIELPSCLWEDGRFVLRTLPQNDVVWREWLSKHAENPGIVDGARANDLSEGRSPLVVAVRRGKMLAAVKPSRVGMENWLFDLADGTVIANLELPCF